MILSTLRRRTSIGAMNDGYLSTQSFTVVREAPGPTHNDNAKSVISFSSSLILMDQLLVVALHDL